MSDPEPNWAPLRAVVPLEGADPWMWMGTAIHDSKPIEQYKHRATRRYLNLDHDGQAWTWKMDEPGCGPWCVEAHEHRQATYTAVPLDVSVALEWALS